MNLSYYCQIPGASGAIQIAERLRTVIDQLRFDSQDGPVMVTACIGVAEYSGGLDSLEELIDELTGVCMRPNRPGATR